MAEKSVGESSADEMRWYVLKVQTNRERTIRESLQKKIRLEELEEFFWRDCNSVGESEGYSKRVCEGARSEAVSGLHHDSDDPE